MKTKILLAVLIVMQSIAWADTQSQDADSTNSSKAEYYAIMMEGAKVGHATHSRIETAGPASPESSLASRGRQVTTTETVDITISRMGIPLDIKTTETCVETVKGEPISFSTTQDMGIGAMKTEGTVGKDGTAQVKTSQMGATQDSNFIWPRGAFMAEGLRLIEMEMGLKEGTSYNVKMFSPGIMAAVDTRVLVGPRQEVDLLGRVVALTKIETTVSMPGMGEMKTVSYADEQLRILKTVMPMMGMNVELVACEKALALGDNESLDIVDKMFLASPEPIEDAASAKSIRYYLKPVGDAGSFTIPSSDNQRVQRQQDGLVLVTVEPVSAASGARFPYKGTDKALIDATKPSRFLQSDDAKIIELSKKAVGNAKDTAEAARRIEQFVADYVENISFSVGYASASEVAASRKGDCSEFAVLCAAMCRAAGIPARVVMGVAYVEDFADKSGFGGHAWVEAYTGGKWVGLDSAFKAGKRGGFNAGHIALAMGDGEPGDFFNLATTLGRFKIEKITVNR